MIYVVSVLTLFLSTALTIGAGVGDRKLGYHSWLAPVCNAAACGALVAGIVCFVLLVDWCSMWAIRLLMHGTSL